MVSLLVTGKLFSSGAGQQAVSIHGMVIHHLTHIAPSCFPTLCISMQGPRLSRSSLPNWGSYLAGINTIYAESIQFAEAFAGYRAIVKRDTTMFQHTLLYTLRPRRARFTERFITRAFITFSLGILTTAPGGLQDTPTLNPRFTFTTQGPKHLLGPLTSGRASHFHLRGEGLHFVTFSYEATHLLSFTYGPTPLTFWDGSTTFGSHTGITPGGSPRELSVPQDITRPWELGGSTGPQGFRAIRFQPFQGL